MKPQILFPEKEVITMDGDMSGVQRILVFFLPDDFTIALQLTARSFDMSPEIRVVMGDRIKELKEEGYAEYRREQDETEQQLVARALALGPDQEVESNPIAVDLLQEILERTQRLVER